MSSFDNIDKTLRTALNDLNLGVDLIGENTLFNPEADIASGDIWIETTQLPSGVDSMMKSGSPSADENTGIFQVSLFTKDTDSGSDALKTLADTVATEFFHGQTYSDFEVIFIQNSSRNNGRINGTYYQIDVSVSWIAYVDRGSNEITIDAFVRADGTAVTLGAAADSNFAASSLSLATLETLKASTAGLTIGFSSQGGIFSTVAAATSAGEACVDMQLGSTYVNVIGEAVTFDLQGAAGVNPIPFVAIDKATSTVRVNSSGSMRLAGSGVNKVVSATGTAGAGTYGIRCIGLDILRNHLADDSDAGDAYSTGNTAEMDVTGGSVADIIALNDILASDNAFTAHDTSKIRVSGVTVQNVNEVAAAVATAQIDIDNITVTDWENAIISLNESETVNITNSTFVNDGSVRAASSGLLCDSGTGAASATGNMTNCSISILANGGTAEYREGTFNFINVDLTALAGTSVRNNVGMGGTDSVKWTWNGGTWKLDQEAFYFVVNHGAIQVDRVHILNTTEWSDNSPIFMTTTASSVPSWIRSSIIELDNDGTNNSAVIKFNTALAYNVNISQNTFYMHGRAIDSRSGVTGVTIGNNTFNGDGSDLVFEATDPSSYDNNHYRDITNKPTDANEVGAEADPGFADPGTDYNITTSSVLYHTGKDLAVTTDFAGNAYHSNTPSVGAYEVV